MIKALSESVTMDQKKVRLSLFTVRSSTYTYTATPVASAREGSVARTESRKQKRK